MAGAAMLRTRANADWRICPKLGMAWIVGISYASVWPPAPLPVWLGRHSPSPPRQPALMRAGRLSSLALAGVRANRDAHVVARLRAAAAAILGKTNLSEWANMRSTHSVSGWSARGGLTRNPYALDRSCSGPGSGSSSRRRRSAAWPII
jgi:hypothetical protein